MNEHVCVYREPEIEDVRTFNPSDAQRALLGDIELRIKIARAPLPDAEQGIAVTAGDSNLVAVERAGIEHKEFGAYLFGEIDVPALEEHDSPIQPFDASRSLQLNPEHPVAAVLLGFIGSRLEVVRGELIRRAREARRGEEARRLEHEADKIATILNQDFRQLRDRLQDIRASAIASGTATARAGKAVAAPDGEAWVRGVAEPGTVYRTGKGGDGSPSKKKKAAPDLSPLADPDAHGRDSVDKAGGINSGKSSGRGGFRVDFRNMGKTEDRSRYDASILTILINLDHPVVGAALTASGVEDVAFRRLTFEIAFSEYAMALGHHILQQDPSMPGDDLLYEVRSSLNRVAASAAALYR